MNSLQKSARLLSLLAHIVVRNPRKLRHPLGMALSGAESVANPNHDLTQFPAVSVDDLLPDTTIDERVTLALLPTAQASVSVMEFVSLVLLMKKARTRRVFEFGTYKGISTTQLALNLPSDGEIYTLDLPEDDPRLKFAVPDPDELAITRETGKGSLIPEALKSRITFIKQDSATFDPAPFAGQMDFVFVDGAHSADYVRNDSEKGWQMLRPGGIIAWHDCRIPDPAVIEFLLRSPYKPSLISNTSVAFACKSP